MSKPDEARCTGLSKYSTSTYSPQRKEEMLLTARAGGWSGDFSHITT